MRAMSRWPNAESELEVDEQTGGGKRAMVAYDTKIGEVVLAAANDSRALDNRAKAMQVVLHLSERRVYRDSPEDMNERILSMR